MSLMRGAVLMQEVERLARMYMQRPVVVTVGAPGVAIDPVKERVSIVGTTRTAAAGAARSRAALRWL